MRGLEINCISSQLLLRVRRPMRGLESAASSDGACDSVRRPMRGLESKKIEFKCK